MNLDELDYEYNQRRNAIIEELEKIKAEIGEKACHINLFDNLMIECSELYKIIDDRISELKGENNDL